MLKRISLPVQLLGVIGFILLFGNNFSQSWVRFFYTISILFKEMLGLCLPVIIFAFVLTGILSFKKKAPVVLGTLVGFVFASNFVVAMVAYAIAIKILPFITQGMSSQGMMVENELQPFFSTGLKSPVTSESALILAMIMGIVVSFMRAPKFENSMLKLKGYIEHFLCFIFIPLLPLYVFGFLLKIYYEGVFISLFQNYSKTFLLIVGLQIIYLFLLYLIAAGFSLKRAMRYIKNALPSYVTAFGTMSSTATVPVSIDAAEKNTGNRALADLSMPIMANVHLLGDSISTPILALVTMLLFLGYIPSIGQYVSFIFYFCTTMFAVSGIPGGGIIMAIPLLVSQLCFTPDMVSIITTLYLLMDSFGTAANVMGDGAMVIIVDKVLKKFKVF